MACETHVLGCTGDKALVLWFAPTQRWTGTKHGCACAARSRMHTYDTHQQPVLESGHRPRWKAVTAQRRSTPPCARNSTKNQGLENGQRILAPKMILLFKSYYQVIWGP